MTALVLPSGETLNVVLDGPENAPAVVLSNSIGTNVELWAPIVSQLAHSHRVIRYDSRGHGGSSVPEGEYSISDLALDVADVLDILEIERASFVGISIGGQTGLAFALEHPDRLDSLVVANTGAKIGTAESWAQRASTVRADGLEAIVTAVTGGWLTPDYAAAHPETLDAMRAWFLSNDPEGYARTCSALAHADFRERLTEITAPTLVISGHDDVPTPPSLTSQIADGVPGARSVIIPGAHLSVQESPGAFAEAVLDHLASA